jgi:hypothetical protein
MTVCAADLACLYELHSDDHDARVRGAIALLVVGVPKVAFFLPIAFRQRKFELRTIPTPSFFFAAADFVDDPWLQHGKTSAYAYGLQHRGLAVKAHAQVRLELAAIDVWAHFPPRLLIDFDSERSRQGLTELSRFDRKPSQSFPRLFRQG